MLEEIRLLPAKEKSILRGHPWVFSGALYNVPSKPGIWAKLCDHNGRFLAIGYTEAGSIAFKIAGYQDVDPMALIEQRIERALQLRAHLGLLNNAQTNIFRAFFAEGDGLPGLIADCYGQHIVLQFHALALYHMRNEIAEIYQKAGFKTVYSKSKESLQQGLALDEYLIGHKHEEVFLEYGNRFKIDWETGQKTGFFIDQRENRRLLGSLAANRRVLNVFSYSGGFSVYALNAHAKWVVSVDSSKKAIELCHNNVELSENPSSHDALAVDAFEYLQNMPDDFDVVVLDPPAFAKNQRVTHNAVQAYKRINAMAMKHMQKGSDLLTFSCSQHISRELFVSTIRAAAIESKKSVQIIMQLQQPADHPQNLLHPEGEYLKGLWVKVLS